MVPVTEKIRFAVGEAFCEGKSKLRPFVTLSYAQSLDGSIAAQPGQRLLLSGHESSVMTHQLRAMHDAILVGIGTVLADDPLLTVRLARGKDPRPVVLDSGLRFPLAARMLGNGGPRPWVASCRTGSEARSTALERKGVRIITVPADDDRRVDLVALLEKLKADGVSTLMVEGGARVITSFLRLRLVDLMVVTIAPVLVGGLNALALPGDSPLVLPRMRNAEYQRMGDDLVLIGDPVWGEM